jgi:hypothetical protein
MNAASAATAITKTRPDADPLPLPVREVQPDAITITDEELYGKHLRDPLTDNGIQAAHAAWQMRVQAAMGGRRGHAWPQVIPGEYALPPEISPGNFFPSAPGEEAPEPVPDTALRHCMECTCSVGGCICGCCCYPGASVVETFEREADGAASVPPAEPEAVAEHADTIRPEAGRKMATQIREATEAADRGETVDLGSFARFAEDQPDPEPAPLGELDREAEDALDAFNGAHDAQDAAHPLPDLPGEPDRPDDAESTETLAAIAGETAVLPVIPAADDPEVSA